MSRPAPPTDASQSPEEWADIAAQALLCRDPDPRAAARRESEDALVTLDRLTAITSRLRRSQDIEGVRRTVERMLALANHFVTAHPSEPAAHLALSIAYQQRSKHARQGDDRAAIEENLKLALGAAQRALLLDHNSQKAQQAIDVLQRRLAEFAIK